MLTDKTTPMRIVRNKDGIRECMLKDGSRVMNDFVKKGNSWYYFDEHGHMLTSAFVKRGDKCYYMQKNGCKASGWTSINGRTYYFSRLTGAMAKGRTQIDEKEYVFDDDGVLLKTYTEGGTTT